MKLTPIKNKQEVGTRMQFFLLLLAIFYFPSFGETPDSEFEINFCVDIEERFANFISQDLSGGRKKRIQQFNMLFEELSVCNYLHFCNQTITSRYGSKKVHASVLESLIKIFLHVSKEAKSAKIPIETLRRELARFPGGLKAIASASKGTTSSLLLRAVDTRIDDVTQISRAIARNVKSHPKVGTGKRAEIEAFRDLEPILTNPKKLEATLNTIKTKILGGHPKFTPVEQGIFYGLLEALYGEHFYLVASHDVRMKILDELLVHSKEMIRINAVLGDLYRGELYAKEVFRRLAEHTPENLKSLSRMGFDIEVTTRVGQKKLTLNKVTNLGLLPEGAKTTRIIEIDGIVYLEYDVVLKDQITYQFLYERFLKEYKFYETNPNVESTFLYVSNAVCGNDGKKIMEGIKTYVKYSGEMPEQVIRRILLKTFNGN